MLTTNVSVNDHLVNGELGTIADTKQESSVILSKIYVKFKNKNVGLTKVISDWYPSENNFVPIVRIKPNFPVFLNSGLTIH